MLSAAIGFSEVETVTVGSIAAHPRTEREDGAPSALVEPPKIKNLGHRQERGALSFVTGKKNQTSLERPGHPRLRKIGERFVCLQVFVKMGKSQNPRPLAQTARRAGHPRN